MLLRISRVACKNVDSLIANAPRNYAKAAANLRGNKNEEEAVNDEFRSEKKEEPIIRCKKPMYDFYARQARIKTKPTLASHGWKNRKSNGDYFSIYPYSSVNEQKNELDLKTFKQLNIDPDLCENLENLDKREPLEIQQLGIPPILEGDNTLLAAETGCGKTLAYLLPMVTKILQWKSNTERDMNCPLGLIVTPSRELAVQIGLELIAVSKNLGIRTKLITGGRTKRMLMNPPIGAVDVLVCSFGVISKLTTFRVYNLRFIKFVVLDEADALFHDTFEDKLRIFMRRIPLGYEAIPESKVPNTAQLVLTSATIPSRMKRVLEGIVNPTSIRHVTTERLHTILVPQKFLRLIPSRKPVELLKFVKPKALSKKAIIIFSNRNATAYWVSQFLNECGVSVTNLNGDMSLELRQGKYMEFLNGKTAVLSTTDGGSRGLDTINVNYVINYEFPLNTASYIHRCGRTGRVGTIGYSRVTNFISKAGEVAVVQKIEMAARRLKPVPIFNLMLTNDEDEKEADKSYDIETDYMDTLIEDLNDSENIPY